MCSNQACWRMFGYSIHLSYPPVIQLNIHLENAQRVIFNLEEIDNLNLNRKTKLLAFFDLCNSSDFARTIKYPDIASYCVWKKVDNEFKWTFTHQGEASSWMARI